jgi:hypothetical protein
MKKIIPFVFSFIFLFLSIVCRAEAQPKVGFSSGSVSVAENVAGGKIDIKVQLSAQSPEIITVDYMISDGDAQIADHGTGQDYHLVVYGGGNNEPPKGTLIFAPGETEKNITIKINNDNVVEMDEKFLVRLESANGAVLGLAHCYVTIIDDDRNYFINVKKPGVVCGHDLSGYALAGDGKTDDTKNLQLLLDHFKNNHPNTGVLFFFPANTYIISSSTAYPAINIPTNTLNITFLGQNNPVTNPRKEQSKILFNPGTPENRQRLFSNQWDLYNKSYDSWRLAFRNLIIDQNYHGSGDWAYEQKQAIIMSSNINNPGKMEWAVQDCRIQFTTAGGIHGHNQTITHIYNVVGEHNFRGLVVISGIKHKLYLKDVLSYGPGYCAGGLDIEPDGVGTCSYDMRDFKVMGGKFQIGLPTLSTSTIYCKNIFLNKALYNIINNNTFIGGKDGQGTFEDCTFYISSWDTQSKEWENLTFNRCTFISYAWGSTPSTHLNSMFVDGQNDRTSSVNFNNCTFKADMSSKSSYQNVQFYGFRYNKKDTDANDTFIFSNCIFDSTLDGGLCPVNYGSPKIILNDCRFDNSCRLVGTIQTASIYLNGRNDYGCYDISINGGTFNAPYLMNIAGFSSIESDGCILRMNNLFIPKAKNNLVVGQQPRKNTYIPLFKAMHPESMPKSNSGGPTIINFPNHGLQTGDSIMWDNISQNDWKANLSPDSNVRLFKVTKIDDNKFTIPLDSSLYGADYSAPTDKGFFWKYPGLRTVIGESGDNPVTSKPAGFAGDRYDAGGTYYRCITTGSAGQSDWVSE